MEESENGGTRARRAEPDAFAERVLGYFYPVHYRFGMEMEQALGQGQLGRKQAALLWRLHSEAGSDGRSEEHTSELQSLMCISYAVFCLKKKKKSVCTTFTHAHIISHLQH